MLKFQLFKKEYGWLSLSQSSTLVQSAMPGIKWSKWSLSRGGENNAMSEAKGEMEAKGLTSFDLIISPNTLLIYHLQCGTLLTFFKESLSSHYLGWISSGF